MNRIRRNRLIVILLIVIGVSVSASLILYSLRQNINLYFTPSEIVLEQHQRLPKMRIGGLVKKNTIVKSTDNLDMHFIVTDGDKDLTVYFNGVLPTLFKEGQGVIADGYLNDKGDFVATNILAKHDENYKPPNLREVK